MSDLLPCRLAYEGEFDQLKELITQDPVKAVALDEVWLQYCIKYAHIL